MNIYLTDHATERCQIRGVRKADISILTLAYDTRVRVAGGLEALSISPARAKALRPVFGNSVIERVADLRAIVNFESGVVVTVIRGSGWHPGKRRCQKRGGKRGYAPQWQM